MRELLKNNILIKREGIMSSGVCKIPECTNDVQCPTMGICKSCYSAMWQAGRKTPSQRLKRLRNLEKYRARTVIMSGSIADIPKHKPLTMTVLPGQTGKKLKIKKKKLHVA